MTRRIASTVAVLLALLSLRASHEAGARSPRPFFAYGNRAESALPDTKLSFDFRTSNAHSLSVDIFAVDRATYDRIHSNDDSEIDFRSAALRHAARAVVPSDSYGFAYATTHLDFPGLPIGLYAIRVNAGAQQSIDGLDVTTFGLLNAQNESGSIQYAVDLRTFHKRGDVVVEAGALSDDGPKTQPMHVTTDGIASFPAAASNVTATADDGSIAFTNTYDYGTSSQERREYLQLDRPLYRPGDLVSYRIVTRTGAIGGYAIPKDPTHVTLSDPSGKKLFDDTQTYDAYGTLHGTFQLADDTQLGTYTVREGDGAAGSFTVEAYAKPEYIVDVAAPKSGDVVEGDVAKF